ncbi:hypothetical protein WA158_008295 [Blastocystis sp. Blastoise]
MNHINIVSLLQLKKHPCSYQYELYHSHFLRQKNFSLLRVIVRFSEMDTYDSDVLSFFPEYPLNKRSRITEILVYGSLLCTLTNSGVCSAYNTNTMKRICFLNSNSQEIIRSIYLNKYTQSIDLVIIDFLGDSTCLTSRSISIHDIINGNTNGKLLFQNENLIYPSFIEFDSINRIILTFTSNTQTYKVWSLLDYSLLYSIHDQNIVDIRLSLGTMVVVHGIQTVITNKNILNTLHMENISIPLTETTSCSLYNKITTKQMNQYIECSSLLLSFININTGQQLYDLTFYLPSQSEYDFLELFGDCFMLKTKNEPLYLVNLVTQTLSRMPMEKMNNIAYLFLYNKNNVIIINQSSIEIWNFNCSLEAIIQKTPISSLKNTKYILYMSESQDFLVYYYKGDQGNDILCFYDLIHYQLLYQFQQNYQQPNETVAIEGISCIYFHEESLELYTGIL